jgi:hemolysin activation/secretion protein
MTFLFRFPVAALIVAALCAFAVPPAKAQSAQCAAPARGGERLGQVRVLGGSAYLPDAQVQAIAAAHAPCARTPESVEALLSALNAAYAVIGAELAYADFAGLDGTTVLVELVEIRFGRVRVDGATHTRESYIRDRAAAAPGDLADIARLRDRLGRLPETDDIRVEANLTPGAETGTTDLTLQVDEPPQYRGFFSLDNTGNPDSGTLRASIGASIASLTGLRDPLALSLSASAGTRQIALSYSRPILDNGARVSISANHERSRLVNAVPPLDQLRTQATVVALGLSVPLRANEAEVDRVNATLTVAMDSSELAGLATTDLSTIEIALGTSHLRRFPGVGAWGITQQVRLGQVRDHLLGTRESYVRLDGTAFALRALGSDWTLGSELRWQWASRALPPYAQFSATGRAGVRGYVQVSASDDVGWLARAEMRRNAFALGESGVQISPFGFVDAGRGASHGAGGLGWGPLRASVGLGVDASRLSPDGTGWTANLTVALPLRDALPRVRARHTVATLTFGMSF